MHIYMCVCLDINMKNGFCLCICAYVCMRHVHVKVYMITYMIFRYLVEVSDAYSVTRNLRT